MDKNQERLQYIKRIASKLKKFITNNENILTFLISSYICFFITNIYMFKDIDCDNIFIDFIGMQFSFLFLAIKDFLMHQKLLLKDLIIGIISCSLVYISIIIGLIYGEL